MRRSWVKCADGGLMRSVFALSVIYFVMWLVEKTTTPVGVFAWGKIHIQIIMLYLAQTPLVYFLWWKMGRFKTCRITKVAVYQYAVLVLFNLIYYIFPIPYSFRMDIVQIVLIGGMSAMVVIYLLTKIFK